MVSAKTGCVELQVVYKNLSYVFDTTEYRLDFVDKKSKYFLVYRIYFESTISTQKLI